MNFKYCTLASKRATPSGADCDKSTLAQGANCIGCVKSSSPTYWNMVRVQFPEVFKDRAEQSRRLGCKLIERKKERIFLDELLPTDKGGKLKSYECGIFCDTK